MIQFVDFDDDFTHRNAVLIKSILDISKKIKDKNEIIYAMNARLYTQDKFPSHKRLIISGENVFDKFPIQYDGKKVRFFYLLNSIIQKIKMEDIVYSIYFKFFSNQNKLNYLRPKLVEYCKSLSENPCNHKKNYAIICNNVKAENILNFPYFFHVFLHRFEEFVTIKKEKKYTTKKKFCAFIVSNPRARDRIRFFRQLSKYKKIDSFGPLFNNQKVPRGLIEKYKYDGRKLRQELKEENDSFICNSFLVNQELFRDYKFVICFESSYAKDYITEKLPNVMMANSVGIYRGAENIGEFFNTKSFINYDDYESYNKMIEKIRELDQDEEKYQKFLEEPFFIDNKMPSRIKTAKQDLYKFVEKMITD